MWFKCEQLSSRLLGRSVFVTRQKRLRGILRATLTQAISPWEALGKTSSVTAPKVAL